MAVKLRLRRLGRRKRPMYSVVAADSRSPRDGRFIEDLGRYNPLNEPATVDLKSDRLLYWLEQGAQPSDTVRSLLSREGLMLALHLRRKGKSEEEIQSAMEEHRAQAASKAATGAMTAAERRRHALEEERKRMAEAEAEAARQRAAEAKKREEAAAAAAAEAETPEAEAETAEPEATAQPEAEAETAVSEAAPAEAEAEAASPEAEAETAAEASAEQEQDVSEEETEDKSE